MYMVAVIFPYNTIVVNKTKNIYSDRISLLHTTKTKHTKKNRFLINNFYIGCWIETLSNIISDVNWKFHKSLRKN